MIIMATRTPPVRYYINPENDLRRLKEYVRNPDRIRGIKHNEIYVFPITWLDTTLRGRLEEASVIRRVGRGPALRSRGVDPSMFGVRYSTNLFYEVDAALIEKQ